MQNSKQSKPNKTKEPEKPGMSSETLILFAAEIRNAIESGKTAMSEALIACDIVVKVMIQCGINFPPNRFREMCGFSASSPSLYASSPPTREPQVIVEAAMLGGTPAAHDTAAVVGQWIPPWNPPPNFGAPDGNATQVIRTEELDRAIREILTDPAAAIQTRLGANQTHGDLDMTRELTATEIAMARNEVGDTTRPPVQEPPF